MKKAFLLFTICLLSSLSLQSQNGIPYISYLDSREGYEAGNWSVCQDSHNAMLFAGRKGLMRYDGVDWERLRIPYLPYKVRFNPYDQHVYVMSDQNYGYIIRNDSGQQVYEALTFDGELGGQLMDIHFTDSTVVIWGDQSLSIHALDDLHLQYRYFHDSYGKFSGLLSTKHHHFVNISERGLFRVNGDTLLSAGISNWNPDNEILFSLPHDEDRVLVGTSGNELLVFDGQSFNPYSFSKPEYLEANYLTDGIILNDSIYVFSTAFGGAILAERSSGKIVHILNYGSGLPDDEIYSLARDRDNGLWLTYGFGSCRVDLAMAVKDYSHYPGLEGLLTNLSWYEGELYVATTEGLFYLAEVKNYEDVEVVYRKTVPVKDEKSSRRKKKETIEEIKPEPVQEEVSVEEEQPKERRRPLRNLFTRKKKEEEEPKEDVVIKHRQQPEAEENQDRRSRSKAPATRTQLVKKKVSKLRSVEHVFQKIEGMNNRCDQLIGTEQGLLVGSSSGIYIVSEYESSKLADYADVSHISEKNSDGKYFVVYEEGVASLSFEDGEAILSTDIVFPGPQLFSAWCPDSVYWLSGLNTVYRVWNEYLDSLIIKEYPFDSFYPEQMHLSFVDDILYLFAETAIYYYSPEADSFLVYNSENEALQDLNGLGFFPLSAGQQWLKAGNRMLWFNGDSGGFRQEKWDLFENITSFHTPGGMLYWIIDDYERIYQIGKGYTGGASSGFRIFLEAVSNEDGKLVSLYDLNFDPGEKLVRLHVSAPYFLRSQQTMYQYRIDQRMEQWSDWSTDHVLEILTEPGEYHVFVRARNVLGQISPEIEVQMNVRSPFTQSHWFYLSFLPLVFGLAWLFFYVRERKLRRDKHILEMKVEERTREIQRQKEKIELQKNEIEAQKDDITSSITYASRIQKAVLPSRLLFEKSFADHFILYKPRDIVSGDFYWVTEMKGGIIFAVADCTGHGVPGAFMSMLGNSFLNEITKGEGSALPAAEILNKLRDMVNIALTQSGEQTKANDGMDITLCKYYTRRKEIHFTGAYNPFYLVRKGELTETKGDRMPIGYYPKKKKFTEHVIKMQKDDMIYLFSDGYPDQFGGPFGKKYTTRQFKQILTAISTKSMAEQQSRLELELETWQGNSAQVDDIIVLGIRI